MCSFGPSASLKNLQIRADLLQKVRLFFAEKGIMEVETPLVSPFSNLDENIEPLLLQNQSFLITSPEFHMKRLIASGSGPIYQICKVFRKDEVGARHNPEFTMLEYYRPEFDDLDLRNEITELLQGVCGWPKAEEKTYQEIFLSLLQLDPFQMTHADFLQVAKQQNLPLPSEFQEEENCSKDQCLDFLMGFCIEPELGKERPIFITHYPKSQAALAKIDIENRQVARRFELYYKGIELCNGYFELNDQAEQEARFLETNRQRRQAGKPELAIDPRFLEAVGKLPKVAGVAIGIDRVTLLLTKAEQLAECISFAEGKN